MNLRVGDLLRYTDYRYDFTLRVIEIGSFRVWSKIVEIHKKIGGSYYNVGDAMSFRISSFGDVENMGCKWSLHTCQEHEEEEIL